MLEQERLELGEDLLGTSFLPLRMEVVQEEQAPDQVVSGACVEDRPAWLSGLGDELDHLTQSHPV